jgi:hypothetical protein
MWECSLHWDQVESLRWDQVECSLCWDQVECNLHWDQVDVKEEMEWRQIQCCEKMTVQVMVRGQGWTHVDWVDSDLRSALLVCAFYSHLCCKMSWTGGACEGRRRWSNLECIIDTIPAQACILLHNIWGAGCSLVGENTVVKSQFFLNFKLIQSHAFEVSASRSGSSNWNGTENRTGL